MVGEDSAVVIISRGYDVTRAIGPSTTKTSLIDAEIHAADGDSGSWRAGGEGAEQRRRLSLTLMTVPASSLNDKIYVTDE